MIKTLQNFTMIFSVLIYIWFQFYCCFAPEHKQLCLCSYNIIYYDVGHAAMVSTQLTLPLFLQQIGNGLVQEVMLE